MKLTIGSGSFHDFLVILDGEWPTVPRIGETIFTGAPDNQFYGQFVVKDVAYQCGENESLYGVLVLVAPAD